MLTSNHLLWQNVKPRCLPMEGNFLSVPVLYMTLIFSFCLVQLQKHSQPWKKYSDKILLDQFYISEYLKRFIMAMWPKKCAKLSKDGKFTVKRGCALDGLLK